MSSNIVTQQPFLLESRNFPPTKMSDLTDELDRMYIDIASKVNDRSIGIYSTLPSINGDAWFLSGGNQKKLAQRKVIPITGAGNYSHNITVNSSTIFVNLYGVFTDGSSNWYPLPYVNVTAVNNQVSLSLTSTNVVVTAGAGSPPTISSGNVIIEWLSV